MTEEQKALERALNELQDAFDLVHWQSSTPTWEQLTRMEKLTEAIRLVERVIVLTRHHEQ